MTERAIPVNIDQFLHKLLCTHHLKIHGYTANMFYQQTCQCACSNAVMSDMIFFKLHISKITVPYIRLSVTHQEV